MNNKAHFDSLQSLRGIAATIVLIHHSIRTFDDDGLTWLASDVIFNAHAAVVLFFVLSGFVLSLSLTRTQLSFNSVLSYYVRRSFRIFPAMWFGVLLGVMYFLLLRPMPAPLVSSWMGGLYSPEHVGPKSLFVLVGLDHFFLPPLWTITIELIMSFLLPVFILLSLFSKGGFYAAVLGLAGLSLMSDASIKGIPLYAIHFAIGMLIATSPKLARSFSYKPAFLFSLIVLIFFRQLADWDYHSPVPGLVEGLAAAVIISYVVNRPLHFLSWTPLVSIGNWSYGIYLFHIPVAYSVARLVSQTFIPQASLAAASLLVLVATTAITIPLSAASFRFMELPAVRFGQRIGRIVESWSKLYLLSTKSQ